MTQEQKLNWLITYLLEENQPGKTLLLPSSLEEKKQLYRALQNVRQPLALPEEFLQVQDSYLQEELDGKKVVTLEDLTPVQENIYLWQGDITTLQVDAIVNAANSALLGCFYPNHNCIDNVIHTAAGAQLRLACDELMQKQGHSEKTGQAKITPGYNLPSSYVIHTVGPIIEDEVRKEDEELLASSYEQSLELAEKTGLTSVAFCCISTGVFRFPNHLAARIAIDTVTSFLKTHPQMKVIFNVFLDKDLEIYRGYLEKD